MISNLDVRQSHATISQDVSLSYLILVPCECMLYLIMLFFIYLTTIPLIYQPRLLWHICLTIPHMLTPLPYRCMCTKETWIHCKCTELLLLFPNTLVMLLQYIFPIYCTHVIVVLCFVVVLFLVPNGFMWSIPMFFRVSSLALRQSQHFPNVREATQKYMVKI